MSVIRREFYYFKTPDFTCNKKEFLLRDNPIFKYKAFYMKYLFLGIAIIAEVIATSALKGTEGFSKFWPSVLVVLGYGTAFYLLSLTLKEIPVGVAYAIWSGLGIVLVSAVGMVLYKQKLDLPAIIGLLLIIAGVIVVNVFSKTSVH